MRLVTYDRGGQRRLGAILEGEVVDLPDAVGHPAFPVTLEGLVSSSRGTVMDAARAALSREDALDWRVPRPRILPPLFPRSLLSPNALDGERRIVGPEDEVAWPLGAAWLAYRPRIAAVVGLEGRRVSQEAAGDHVFGYTLVGDYAAREATGSPLPTAEGMPLAIGPCVVTADAMDPQRIFLELRVDDDEVAKGNLNGSHGDLLGLVVAASREAPLERGDAFALTPFRGSPHELWPGALVELAAEGIGTLRNRVGRMR